MLFASVSTKDAVGAIAAHSVRAGAAVLKKGSTVTADTAQALAAAGVTDIVVVRLEAGDVGEDEAARRLAEAVTGGTVKVSSPFTGRANLFAERNGVLVVDKAAIDRINAVDEAITIATLAPHATVSAGEMVGTVKIIPYAVRGDLLRAAIAAAGDQPAVSVAPFRARKVAVVSTLLPGLKPSVVAKTLGVLCERLAPSGSTLGETLQTPHQTAPLASALRGIARDDASVIVIFGASAITDRRDVVPAAIEAAGGRIEHLGMPVDPGNLLLLGELGGKPVIGAPGCARSPKENGFDWVLARLLADIPVTRADIMGMGVGGLLMEIVTRPQPREGEGA